MVHNTYKRNFTKYFPPCKISFQNGHDPANKLLSSTRKVGRFFEAIEENDMHMYCVKGLLQNKLCMNLLFV